MVLGLSCSEADPGGGATQRSTIATSELCRADDLVACARRSSLGELIVESPTPATGDPLVIGMINQENTPAGSYPELSQAVQAAVSFVNEQLGGLAGRPIRVEVCNTGFSAEGSTDCGQKFVEARVPAVLGGIDVFGNAVDVLAANGVPYVGGIPVSMQSVRSDNSFQWSGGTWGAAVAFAHHAVEAHATSVSIVYGDFGSIADAAKVGEAVLKRAGATVQMVPYPVLTTDLTAALSAAVGSDHDAVIVLAADTGCRAGLEGLAALGTRATRYFTGACAAPSITEQVGNAATEGAIFNVEGPIPKGVDDPDRDLYNAVVARYGDGLNPIGAGTVTFRSFMNLYRVLVGLGADPTASGVSTALRSQAGAPSFDGHASTCDRKQFPALPAMCAPQQILARMHNGQLAQIGDWIDVGSIARG